MSENERLWPLERLVDGLDELKGVLGSDVAPTVESIKARLRTAIAARDDGKKDEAIFEVGSAMAELSTLGDRIGPAEGAMMRAVTGEMLKGFADEDRDRIEQNMAVIQSKAGKPKEPGE